MSIKLATRALIFALIASLFFMYQETAGERIKLTIFRFDKLIEINFTLGVNTRRDYSFASLPEPTELQQKLYREYLNADL